MGILNRKTDEQRVAADVAKEAAAREKRHARAKAKFDESPRGLARAAKAAGERYYQAEIVLEQNVRLWGLPGSIDTTKIVNSGFGALLTEIEAEGWRLVHAGWVFRAEGEITRDKLLSSGQQVSTTGKTVGIYLFAATAEPVRTDMPWVDDSDDRLAVSRLSTGSDELAVPPMTPVSALPPPMP